MITMLACGQRGARSSVRNGNGWCRGRHVWLSHDQAVPKPQLCQNCGRRFSLFHPGEASRQFLRSQMMCQLLNAIKKKKKFTPDLDHDLGWILNVLQEFRFWLKKSQVTELKRTIRECYIPAVVENCNFSTWETFVDNHVWLDEDEPGWWIRGHGVSPFSGVEEQRRWSSNKRRLPS